MQPRTEHVGPVLIVEDNPQNQKILKGLCARQGLATAVADNGRVALDMLSDGFFAVYIVDLMMPVMDGRAFIGHL
ncbi:MAG TPA: response regulator, partial [Spirochaetota bacterium]|nr:response regulator [Spirochaetota bacterium]